MRNILIILIVLIITELSCNSSAAVIPKPLNRIKVILLVTDTTKYYYSEYLNEKDTTVQSLLYTGPLTFSIFAYKVEIDSTHFQYIDTFNNPVKGYIIWQSIEAK